MTNSEPQPIIFDPNTLNEKFVQETMGWMSAKKTEDLKQILTEETSQPETYAPEIIEAVQRILTKRGELAHTPILGKRSTQLFGQQVEVKLPKGRTYIFKSYEDLRTAVLEGHIPKDTLVQEIGNQSEKTLTKETILEPEQIPLQAYGNLAALYTPIQYSIKWGVILGIYLGFGIFSGQFSLLSFTHPFTNYSFDLIDDFLISLFILFGLMALFFWDQSQKNVWTSNIKLVLCTLILFSLFFNVGEIFLGLNPWEGWEFRKFILEVFWVIGFFINGTIFGGPLGAILGMSVGYMRSKYFPKAPNAEAEGMRPYRIGLLYPVIFILIAWPLTYFWFVPWFLSTFPTPIGQ